MPSATYSSKKPVTQNHDTIKHTIDAAAAAGGIGAFFSAIPWPEIAGFLSSLWLCTRLYEYFREKLCKSKKAPQSPE